MSEALKSPEKPAENLVKHRFLLWKLYPLFLGFICGFLVFYFLYFLDAFGIQKGLSYSGHSHLFRSLSFGFLTFAYLAFFEGLVKPRLPVSGSRNQAIWYIALVMLGSHLIFILFNYFWNWQEWNMEAYTLILKEFPLLMVLPIILYLAIGRILKPNAPEVTYLLFQSENGKDRLKVKLEEFLYANAAENYITIIYKVGSKTRQHLIRKPLKVLEQDLSPYPSITRCHRSFIVNGSNISSVKQVKGKVTLEMPVGSIPVSKQFQSSFLD